MLVYQASKFDFMEHVEAGAIADLIREKFVKRLGRPGEREVRSWRNSMQYMYMVLNTTDVPDDCGVATEIRRSLHLEPHRLPPHGA